MNSFKNLCTLRAAVMCVCAYVSLLCVYILLQTNSKTNYFTQQYGLGANRITSIFTEKDLEVPVDKPSTSQRCLPVQQGQPHPGCADKNVASRPREAILPQWTLVKSHLEYSVQYWAPPYKNGLDVLEQAQQRVTTVLKVLEKVMCLERLGELGLFSLKEREGSWETLLLSATA